MKEENCKLVIIGSGPAGYTAAFRAADLGLETVLIERDDVLGGVCLNRGCIPSKTMLHIANLIDEVSTADEWGVKCNKPEIDLDQIRDKKEKVVDRLNKGLTFQCKAKKVKVIQASAQFESENSLLLKDAKGMSLSKLNFEQAIIATGSEPFIPDLFLPIKSKLMTSTEALELASLPKKLCVIGAGAIGLELGSVYASLGSEVTVIEMLPNLLPGTDKDIIAVLNRTLMKKFKKVYLGTKVVKTEVVKGKCKLHLEGEEDLVLDFDKVLVAAGRKSNVDDLQLSLANVNLEQNKIITDNQQRTSNKNVYAIGDVTTGPMLAHKGYKDGTIAAEVAAGLDVINDAKVIPSVIYTYPQVATAGISEEQAKADGLNYKVAKFNWVASGKALSMGKESGLTKLIVNESGQILGCQLIGENVGELIGEVCLAIEMGAHYKDIALTVHAHPTLSESIAEALHTLKD